MQHEAHGVRDHEFYKLAILNLHETRHTLAKNNLLDGFTQLCFKEALDLEGNRQTAED